MKSLFQQVSEGGQHLKLMELLEYKGNRLRVQVKSDSYRSQCFAMVECWDGAQWQHVHSIPCSEMTTEKGLIYRSTNNLPTHRETLFAADRDELLRVAALIIG